MINPRHLEVNRLSSLLTTFRRVLSHSRSLSTSNLQFSATANEPFKAPKNTPPHTHIPTRGPDPLEICLGRHPGKRKKQTDSFVGLWLTWFLKVTFFAVSLNHKHSFVDTRRLFIFRATSWSRPSWSRWTDLKNWFSFFTWLRWS